MALAALCPQSRRHQQQQQVRSAISRGPGLQDNLQCHARSLYFGYPSPPSRNQRRAREETTGLLSVSSMRWSALCSWSRHSWTCSISSSPWPTPMPRSTPISISRRSSAVDRVWHHTQRTPSCSPENHTRYHPAIPRCTDLSPQQRPDLVGVGIPAVSLPSCRALQNPLHVPTPLSVVSFLCSAGCIPHCRRWCVPCLVRR